MHLAMLSIRNLCNVSAKLIHQVCDFDQEYKRMLFFRCILLLKIRKYCIAIFTTMNSYTTFEKINFGFIVDQNSVSAFQSVSQIS